MSSTPQRGAPDQWGSPQGGAGQPSPHQPYAQQPDMIGQGDMPAGGTAGQETPGQGTSGQEYGLPDSSVPRYPQGGGAGGWRPESPVDMRETRVTGRRVVQYIIDYILSGIIPGLAYWLFDRGHGVLHGLGWVFATLISLAFLLWYWVLRPNGHQGQTFGMQLLGLRIISKDGGPANMVQLLVRAVLLIVDDLFFGLVGLITMLCSRYRQRVGDHAARTLVVHATPWYSSSARSQAGADMYGGTRVLATRPRQLVS
jgi:uncharacterized RDD family membrane protein YckC